MALKTYSPDDVKIIFGAFPIASGLADGTFINVDPMGDGTTSQAGADGEVARAMSLDRRYQVTVTLQQTSAANNAMAAAWAADQASNGNGALPFSMTDLRGKTILAGTGWIDSQASAS